MTTKKYTSKKRLSTQKHHSGKKSMTMKHDEKNMHKYCVGCGKKVEIHDVRVETFKGKGNKTRKRLVGKCENGHKFFSFMKSD